MTHAYEMHWGLVGWVGVVGSHYSTGSDSKREPVYLFAAHLSAPTFGLQREAERLERE